MSQRRLHSSSFSPPHGVATGSSRHPPTLPAILPCPYLDTARGRTLRLARPRCGVSSPRLSNAEIAQRLFIGDATVKTQVTRLLAKLGVRDRVQAVVLTYRCGLVLR
ncbi:MAG: response regulator transcription factor [Propionibacteriales bacterium]|nr:response regulator transcription factor [Propionibacteriales bacterium]